MNESISPEVVAMVIASCMGVWALGYGVGQSVAWVRKLRDVV